VFGTETIKDFAKIAFEDLKILSEDLYLKHETLDDEQKLE